MMACYMWIYFYAICVNFPKAVNLEDIYNVKNYNEICTVKMYISSTQQIYCIVLTIMGTLVCLTVVSKVK